MTDFLNPLKWENDVTFLSADNGNHLDQTTADTRCNSALAVIGAMQPADLSEFYAKMRRFEYNFSLVVKTNTDVIIPFPEPKDHADYGVIITFQKRDKYNPGDGAIGFGGDMKTGYSLNVMERHRDRVVVRYQSNKGPDDVHINVSCVGGIDF